MVDATANASNNTAAAKVGKQAAMQLNGSPKRPKHSASSADGVAEAMATDGAQDDVSSRPAARQRGPTGDGEAIQDAEQQRGRMGTCTTGAPDDGQPAPSPPVAARSSASSCASARPAASHSDAAEDMVGVTDDGEEVSERVVVERKAAGKARGARGSSKSKRATAGGASQPAEAHIVVNATGQLAAYAAAQRAGAEVDRKLPAQFDPSRCSTLYAPLPPCDTSGDRLLRADRAVMPADLMRVCSWFPAGDNLRPAIPSSSPPPAPLSSSFGIPSYRISGLLKRSPVAKYRRGPFFLL